MFWTQEKLDQAAMIMDGENNINLFYFFLNLDGYGY